MLPNIKSMVKSHIKFAVKYTISLFLKFPNEKISKLVNISLDEGLLSKLQLESLEKIYTHSKRILFDTPKWRYGPKRTEKVINSIFQELSPYTTLQGKAYLDLGCGVTNPYGLSTIMYLNGAASTIALDIIDTDKIRAAEALYDLLTDCMLDAKKYCINCTVAFKERIKNFYLKALREGNLNQGIRNTPLQHVITDINSPGIPSDSIDIITSRAVLEHFLNFPLATQKLYEIMAPNGIAFHHIDLVDHRSYSKPERYHYWSFLAEGAKYKDRSVNMLRYSEIKKHIKEAGFEILKFHGRKEYKMPPGFSQHIKGRFAQMSEDELNITGIDCVLKKP